jgi:hypothetical protein
MNFEVKNVVILNVEIKIRLQKQLENAHPHVQVYGVFGFYQFLI